MMIGLFGSFLTLFRFPFLFVHGQIFWRRIRGSYLQSYIPVGATNKTQYESKIAIIYDIRAISSTNTYILSYQTIHSGTNKCYLV